MNGVSAQYLQNRRKFGRPELPLSPHDQARFEAWLARYLDSLGGSAPSDGWWHISGSDAASGKQYFALSQEALSELADEFTEDWSELRELRLEWLVADSLCYAELEAAREQLGLSGVYRQGKSRIGRSILNLLAIGLLSVAWLVVVLLLWKEPLAVFLLTVGTSAWLYRKARIDKARAELGAAMVDTYGVLVSVPVCWPLVWESMGESRRKGVVWPAAMYRLVDKLRQMPPR